MQRRLDQPVVVVTELDRRVAAAGFGFSYTDERPDRQAQNYWDVWLIGD